MLRLYSLAFRCPHSVAKPMLWTNKLTLLFRVKIIAHLSTWLSCPSPAKFHVTREIHPEARLRVRRIDSDFFVTHALTPDHDWALTSQVWARLLSEQYKQHTFWWTHAKVCLNLNRRLRHQASTALRNISANPDKTSALLALSLAAVPDTGLKQRMDLSETSRTFVSGEHDTLAPSTNNLSRIPSSGTSVDTGNANSNHQRTISEVTSLLTLVFQSDTLSKSGSGRQFFQANNSKLEGHRLSRVKQSTDTFCAKESYLNSLQVLTNTLIVMSNLLMASESMDDKNGNIFGESRYV